MSKLLTLDQWSKDVDGRYIVWGQNGAQCVDLVKDKAIRCHGAPKGAYGDGMDMARGLSRLDGWRYEGPSGTPHPGTIVSGLPQSPWHKTYGHVWVFLAGHGDGSWTIKDQNPRPATTRRIMPTAIAGMVHPPAAPAEVPEAEQASPSEVYVVRSGDTLTRIAARVGASVDQLRTWNSIRDVNVIEVGQRLVVQEPRPRYVITWETLNIFAGPGTSYRRLNAEFLRRGLPLVGTGRTSDGWVELSTPYMAMAGATGWVWGEGIKKVTA